VAPLQVVPFAAEHLEPAGRLLAARHAGHRRVTPLLDARFATAAAATAEVAALWAVAGTSGAVAVEDGELAGYLIGAAREDAAWGPNTWVEAAGTATVRPEVSRELYAACAQSWVDAGRTAHYVVVPAHDEALLWVWFGLGFGQQHVHALRQLPAPGGESSGAAVRAARPEDVPILALLDLELPRHQARSPVFSAGLAPAVAEAEAEWVETLADARFGCFVAERAGAVVGSAIACPLELSSLHTPLMRPDQAGFLGFAALFAEARGQGLGRALGEAALHWCADNGFRAVATDWRSTNLLSSRAWPRLGFVPSFLRLHRSVGY
jgi:GNAT superfamily N-acetyltransferase